MCAFFVFLSPSRRSNNVKIPVVAGHEFIVSTDDKYSESCDDKVIWVDYVSLHSTFGVG